MSWRDILLEIVEDGARRELMLCTVFLRDPPDDETAICLPPRQPITPLIGSAARPIWLAGSNFIRCISMSENVQ